MKVLVLGYYHKQNAGDNFFTNSFTKLFPEIEFTFTNIIKSVKEYDAIFIGGGSLLDGPPRIAHEVFHQLLKKKICYLGVGTETDVHPTHLQLMEKAKLIASRSVITPQLERFKDKIIKIPDLVYSLYQTRPKEASEKKVLILPNISVIPHFQDPIWKLSAWNYFKSEFAQFVEYLILNKYQVNFGGLSSDPALNDLNVANELVNHMARRKDYNIALETDYSKLIDRMKDYSIIITQRYHGSILAQLARVPHLTLYHHDKLRGDYLNEGKYLSYYGVTKRTLIENFHALEQEALPAELPLDPEVWTQFQKRVWQALA